MLYPFSSLVDDRVTVVFIDRGRKYIDNFHLEASVKGSFDAKDMETRLQYAIATFDTKSKELSLKNRKGTS